MQESHDGGEGDENASAKAKPKQYLTFDKALAAIRAKKIGAWIAASFGATFTPWLFKCTDYPKLIFVPAIILCLLFLWLVNESLAILSPKIPPILLCHP